MIVISGIKTVFRLGLLGRVAAPSNPLESGLATEPGAWIIAVRARFSGANLSGDYDIRTDIGSGARGPL